MRHHGRINEESEIRVDCKNLQQRRHSSRALERERPGRRRFGWKAATVGTKPTKRKSLYPTHTHTLTMRQTASPHAHRAAGLDATVWSSCHLVPPFDASGERAHDTRGHDLKDHERETARCRCRLKVVRRTP